MPVKNNVEIYNHLFRFVLNFTIFAILIHKFYLLLYYFYSALLLQYGLWDQIRVDQGKEWILMLFVQEHLAHLRGNIIIVRAPHLQTSSKLVSCVYIVRLKLVFEASNLHLCPPFQSTESLC